MYYCAPLKKSHQKDWEKLITTNPAVGFQQSFEWANFKKLEDWIPHHIGLFDQKNTLKGGALILQYKFPNNTNFLYIPQGPILNYQKEDELFWQWRSLEIAIHKLISQSKNNLTTHLRIEPRTHKIPEWFLSTFVKAPLNLMPKHTQILNLKDTHDNILAQMKPKGRYNIKLAIKNNVKIKQIKNPKSKDIEIFYNLYKHTFQRNKFHGKKITFFQNFLKACKNISHIFVAENQKNTLAAAIILYYGKTATYLYGASSNNNRQLMAPYLLHWEIIKDAKSRKFTQYDFWGVNSSSKDKKHTWHGLSQFKKKFGGEQFNFIGSHDFVIQKDLYQNFLKRHEIN
ncbi:lipid II:glycine glycyltransferase FemX [Patescibacteria group bacterium]